MRVKCAKLVLRVALLLNVFVVAGAEGAGVITKGTEIQGIQLTDGWYPVNAMIDKPLTALIWAGKIQV